MLSFGAKMDASQISCRGHQYWSDTLSTWRWKPLCRSACLRTECMSITCPRCALSAVAQGSETSLSTPDLHEDNVQLHVERLRSRLWLWRLLSPILCGIAAPGRKQIEYISQNPPVGNRRFRFLSPTEGLGMLVRPWLIGDCGLSRGKIPVKSRERMDEVAGMLYEARSV